MATEEVSAALAQASTSTFAGIACVRVPLPIDVILNDGVLDNVKEVATDSGYRAAGFSRRNR